MSYPVGTKTIAAPRRGNHIQTLTAERNQLATARADALLMLAAFRAHLGSAKFGVQADGEVADYIRTGDVKRWLDCIENELG
jgi:hypothetical protein